MRRFSVFDADGYDLLYLIDGYPIAGFDLFLQGF